MILMTGTEKFKDRTCSKDEGQRGNWSTINKSIFAKNNDLDEKVDKHLSKLQLTQKKVRQLIF